MQACPVGCIALVEDAEGFLFPEIDRIKCINCGKCRKVCPVLTATPKVEPVAGYAYRVNDDALLSRTSSGGFFTLLAEKVLREGGVVFGASFNKCHEVVHAFVERIEDLDALRRSKYVQSRIGNSFEDCLKFLNEGRKVLFCGTPCQVKALNLFIGKKRDNLITVDFVCHGVPSPGVFRKYLAEICEKYGESLSDVKEINFREKIAGFAYGFSFTTKNKKYTENPRENMFLKGFLSDLYLRQSCHRCSAKSFTSGSDYTICDFWGIEKVLPSFPRGGISGVTQVFVTNDKLNAFDSLNGKAVVMPFNSARIWYRPIWLRKSVPTTRRRKKFFDENKAGRTVCECVSKFGRLTLIERICMKLSLVISTIERKVGIK